MTRRFLYVSAGLLVAAGAVAAGSTLLRFARASSLPGAEASGRGAPADIVVPRAAGEVRIDGRLQERGWRGPKARTGAFVAEGEGAAAPYSEARLVHRDGELFVVLYAADEDIRTNDARHDEPLGNADAFELVFETASGTFVIDVSAAGVVTDARRAPNGTLALSWESHARTGIHREGTANDSTDRDEEWLVELAVPLDALGLTGDPGERFGLTMRRCDDIANVGRACGVWQAGSGGGALVLGGALALGAVADH